MDRLKRRPRSGRVVAVTGARTFLGRNLVALLEEDASVAKVIVIDIRNAATAGPKTCFYQLDLTQPGVESRLSEILNAEAVHCVCHLAFAGSPSRAVAWAHELERIGTMHLLSACRAQEVPQLVACTTTLVYGPHAANPNHLTEDSPLRGLQGCPFVADKLDVERQLRAFATSSDTLVTVLRMAPVLGPSVDNYVTRWLSRRLVPVVLGHDPLIQLIHEVDAVAALKLAVDASASGIYNVVGQGVMPVSTMVGMAGRVAIPLPQGVLRRLAAVAWLAQMGEAPAEFVQLLRFLCVAEGSRAQQALGFRPAYSCSDAVLDFEGAQRMRDARLLDHGQARVSSDGGTRRSPV